MFPEQTDIHAQLLDLQTLAGVAERLPLSDGQRRTFSRFRASRLQLGLFRRGNFRCLHSRQGSCRLLLLCGAQLLPRLLERLLREERVGAAQVGLEVRRRLVGDLDRRLHDALGHRLLRRQRRRGSRSGAARGALDGMSELLLNWLNNEVGLSTNVANFEKDFSNGYLFGEVLHKFRQQDDFDHFDNRSTYEAKLANFKRIEPTLKALGIKVNATQSNAMMNGERGSALRLLYQLKMATERLMMASDTGMPQPKSGGAPAGSSVTKGIRVPRDQFDNHERRFFEHRLRATCPNPKHEHLQKVTKRYEQEMDKQEVVAYEMDRLEQAHIAEQREIHRFGLRERMRQNKVAKDDWIRNSVQQIGRAHV